MHYVFFATAKHKQKGTFTSDASREFKLSSSKYTSTCYDPNLVPMGSDFEDQDEEEDVMY